MQMKFRLLDIYKLSFLGADQGNKHRNRLGNAETHVSNIHTIRAVP